MLNAGYKKEALKVCKQAQEEYKKQYNATIENCEILYKQKEKAVMILEDYENYINSLCHKPKHIEKITSEISVRKKEFEKEIEKIKLENKEGNKVSQNIAGAGAMAGVGVAAFGPTVAMSIATTFGTASTGVAIGGLCGAAKTSAALAWLGGGTIASGGGGMVGGQALLSMAGPAGWVIGGTAIVGAAIWASIKNKKIAEKAEEITREVKNETSKIQKIDIKVRKQINIINELNIGVSNNLYFLKMNKCSDYKKFSKEDKDKMQALINSAESLSKKIGEKIAL